MIKSFTVKGYKKLNHFELIDLSRINLITGESDLGKSCILESLFVFCSGNDVNMLIRERGMRTKSWTPKRGDLWHIQSNKLLQH